MALGFLVFLQEFPIHTSVSQVSILGPMFFLQYINDLHNNVAAVPQGSILCPMFFLQNINDFHDNVICNIAIDADNTILYSKYDYASDLCQQLKLVFELESRLQNTGLGKEVACEFQ